MRVEMRRTCCGVRCAVCCVWFAVCSVRFAVCSVLCAVELIVTAAVDAAVCFVQSVSILRLFANTKEPMD